MTHSIACVSFLNSKPLVDPLVNRPDVQVHFAVPSHLLELLASGTASAGLLSVVNYHAPTVDLLLLPAGMIGCDGPTLTVRLYSRVPPAHISLLHADTDSHTSVLLAQVILRERYGISPQVVPLTSATADNPAAMLLIGDKVVNASPDAAAYPHQLDLGEEWKRLTGLPFVFAMWMIRRDYSATHGTAVAQMLDDARRRGADLTEDLLDRYASEKQWPRELARKYFTSYLRYEVTLAARQGLARFFELTARHGLLAPQKKLEYLEVPR